MTLSAEEELALRLCGSARRRHRDRGTIERLATEVPPDNLLAILESQRIVALAGERLEQAVPGVMSAAFRERVAEHVAHNRHRGALFSHLSMGLCADLEAAGIRCVQLKGWFLAERAHGDIGLRSAQSDIDILVEPDRLRDAVDLLVGAGYAPYDDVDWSEGLPHYHARLERDDLVRVSVEVHWRVHWYEKRFATEALARADVAPDGQRRLRAADEIAILLLVFARDGFVGLRLPADIAAWWDRHGAKLEQPPLDPVIASHPGLRRALLVAADVAEREVGVPAGELVSPSERRSRRARLACRLSQWSMRDAEADLITNITLSDLLLTPRGAYRVYARHYWLQPMDHYLLEYGWPPGDRARNQVRRLAHAGARAARAMPVFAGRLWQLRGGRTWGELPEDLAW